MKLEIREGLMSARRETVMRPSRISFRLLNMFEDIYPHRDGTWPLSQEAIEEQFAGVDAALKRKMLWENTRSCLSVWTTPMKIA